MFNFRATRTLSGGSNGSLTSRFKADQEKIRAREKARAAVSAARHPETNEDHPPSVVEAPGLLYNTQVDMSGIELLDSAPPPTQPLVGPLKPSNEAEVCAQCSVVKHAARQIFTIFIAYADVPMLWMYALFFSTDYARQLGGSA